MHRAIRTQVDDKFDGYSRATALDFTGTRDMVRNEWAADADINNIMRRFGVTGQIPAQRNPEYRATDFDIDLQSALIAVNETKAAYANLPQDLKDKYGTWVELLVAVDKGEIVINVGDPPPPTPEPTK